MTDKEQDKDTNKRLTPVGDLAMVAWIFDYVNIIYLFFTFPPYRVNMEQHST
ncbi:hypothetical protein [Enterobacter hormaechei]|uniref:hypothetical protein n=1 Tax=Enterobacter hormaechei TaxID=158836 RepID=UPI0039C6C6DA